MIVVPSESSIVFFISDFAIAHLLEDTMSRVVPEPLDNQVWDGIKGEVLANCMY